MYAVITSGGKQYRVAAGDTVKLEKLEPDSGQSFDFEEVLLIADGENIKVGTPLVKDAKVSAEVVNHGRHKKIEVIKFKRRKHHMKRMGHRQDYTEVRITTVQAPGFKPSVAAKPAEEKKAPAKEKPETKATEKPKAAEKPKADAAPKAKPVAEKKVAPAKKPAALKKAPAAKKAETKPAKDKED